MSTQTADFISLYHRYEKLDNGLKAQLRRVAEPEDLRDTPALYRLFPSKRAHAGWLRVAFLLPWCQDCGDKRRSQTPSFGKRLAEAKVNQMRLFQVARAGSPYDVVQFRRLAIQLQYPTVDWAELGWLLLPSESDRNTWQRAAKRDLIESYFLA